MHSVFRRDYLLLNQLQHCLDCDVGMNDCYLYYPPPRSTSVAELELGELPPGECGIWEHVVALLTFLELWLFTGLPGKLGGYPAQAEIESNGGAAVETIGGGGC